MASLINCIGIPNLSQNCYLSSIIQLLKCCTPACDVVLNHYEQCLECVVRDWNEECNSTGRSKYMSKLFLLIN